MRVSDSLESNGRPISGFASAVRRILVVDDEVRVVQAVRVALASEFAVTWTGDPSEALAWLEAGDSYDVILCDLVMPKMSGIDLWARVRERRGSDVAARFVFMAGGSLSSRVQELMAGVPNPVLYKPFGLDELCETIHRRMGRPSTKARALRR